MPDPVVWLNPSCSKCRTAQGILTDHGIDATYLDHLRQPPPVVARPPERVLEVIGDAQRG
jgi:arsenate reductase-like glutaredoxin family protein